MFLRIVRGQVYDSAATLAELARWGRGLGARGLGLKDGDAGQAGFVRVVQGRLAYPVRLAAMRAEVERTLRDRAPHVLGVTVAEHADGTGFTEFTYCTSERETRAADRQMPVEMAVQLGTVRSYVEGLEEVELRSPVLASPAVPVVS